jgi:hypothetical protein
VFRYFQEQYTLLDIYRSLWFFQSNTSNTLQMPISRAYAVPYCPLFDTSASPASYEIEKEEEIWLIVGSPKVNMIQTCHQPGTNCECFLTCFIVLSKHIMCDVVCSFNQHFRVPVSPMKQQNIIVLHAYVPVVCKD